MIHRISADVLTAAENILFEWVPFYPDGLPQKRLVK